MGKAAGKIGVYTVESGGSSSEIDLGNTGSDFNINWTLGPYQKATLSSPSSGGYVWVLHPPMTIARSLFAAAGTTTTALAWGGGTTNSFYGELWGGSSWSTTGALPTIRTGQGGCGTAAACLSIGGGTSAPGTGTNVVYKWDSSSWATTTVLPANRGYVSCAGTTTEALQFGGYSSVAQSTNYKYSGGAWSTTGALPSARYGMGVADCGSTSSVLIFGMASSLTSAAKWDGSSWATTSSLNVGRQYVGGCGTTSDALSFGGNKGFYANNTESWNSTSWATTTNLNTAHYGVGVGIGSNAPALSMGSQSLASTTELWSSSYLSTASFTNPSGAGKLILRVIQPATPNVQSLSLPSISWSGSSTMSQSRGKIDIISLYFDGVNYYGKVLSPV